MELWEQAEFLAALDSLGAAACAELVEGATAVGLHGVLAHEESLADLAVAEAAGHELEDFQLSAGDAEALAGGVVGDEVGCGRGGDRDFNFDYAFARGKEPGSEPDAGTGEEDGDQDAIDSDRVLEDNEVELSQLEQRDEDAAYQPEDQHLLAHHALSHGGWRPWYRAAFLQGLWARGLSDQVAAERTVMRLRGPRPGP